MRKFDQVKADAAFLKENYLEAFDMYMCGAREEEDPRAAFNVAYMYHRGIGVPCHYEQAREFYSAAACLEGGAALYNLALLYIRGQGGEPDFKKAVELMKQAADMECADAGLYLGIAYTLGCVFDPLDVECISMIPFYRRISRSADTLLLEGVGTDPEIENQRFEAISQDEYEATDRLESVLRIKDETYVEKQIGTAKFLVGQALIEGVGKEYNPRRGYRMIESAALKNGSVEAAQYLLQRTDEALVHGVSMKDVLQLMKGKFS